MWLFKYFTQPTPEFCRPWRSLDWNENKQKLLTTVNNFKPGNPEVATLRILLYGPQGAGKSSFFNSVNNALQGRITTRALAHATETDRSFTLEFNPLNPVLEDNSKYNKNPTLKDRIHCLVAVLPAHTVSMLDDKIISQMRQIREKGRDLGIPQVIIMTKIDQSCELVKDDLKKTYKSKKIKHKMEQCSAKLGIPVSYIYPVKNYHEEHTNDDTMDILILDALQNIIHFADDYIEDQVDSK